MAAASTRVVALPLGSYPRWELEDEDMNVDNAEWHTIADRYVFVLTYMAAPEIVQFLTGAILAVSSSCNP